MDSSNEKALDKEVEKSLAKTRSNLSPDLSDLRLKPSGKENTTTVHEYTAPELAAETAALAIGMKCYCTLSFRQRPTGIVWGCIICQPHKARQRLTAATVPTMAGDLSILLHSWQWEQEGIPQYAVFSEPSNVYGSEGVPRRVRPSLMAQTSVSARDFEGTGWMGECVSPRTGNSNPFLEASAAAAAAAAALSDEDDNPWVMNEGGYAMFPANLTGHTRVLDYRNQPLPPSLLSQEASPFPQDSATPSPFDTGKPSEDAIDALIQRPPPM